MNSEWLTSFAVFSQYLNFTHAAAQLHISQPALFVQIRKLSEHIGKPLYFKTGRKLQLTESGRRTAAFAHAWQQQTAALLAELRGNEQRGTLASGKGAYLYLLGPALAAFHRLSNWRLKLLTMNAPQALEAVRRGQADVAVAALDELPDDLDARHICAVGYMVAMPQEHPLTTHSHLQLSDLHQQSLILPPHNAPLRRTVAQAFRRADAQFEVSVEAQGWDLMLHFTRLGFGLSIVNDFCTLPEGITARPLRDMPPVDYYLFHSTQHLSQGSNELIRIIQHGA